MYRYLTRGSDNSEVYQEGNEAIEREMIAVIPSLTSGKRAEVLKYLSLITTDESEMSDAKYIVFNNGIYNLETETLEPFSPSIIVKNKISFDYNDDAYDESMDAVLDRLSCHDDSIRDFA